MILKSVKNYKGKNLTFTVPFDRGLAEGFETTGDGCVIFRYNLSHTMSMIPFSAKRGFFTVTPTLDNLFISATFFVDDADELAFEHNEEITDKYGDKYGIDFDVELSKNEFEKMSLYLLQKLI